MLGGPWYFQRVAWRCAFQHIEFICNSTEVTTAFGAEAFSSWIYDDWISVRFCWVVVCLFCCMVHVLIAAYGRTGADRIYAEFCSSWGSSPWYSYAYFLVIHAHVLITFGVRLFSEFVSRLCSSMLWVRIRWIPWTFDLATWILPRAWSIRGGADQWRPSDVDDDEDGFIHSETEGMGRISQRLWSLRFGVPCPHRPQRSQSLLGLSVPSCSLHDFPYSYAHTLCM